MTKAEFMPTTLDDKFTHVVEECSEVTAVCADIVKIICKIKRFGLNNAQANSTTNKIYLLEAFNKLNQEIADVQQVMQILHRAIVQHEHEAAKPDVTTFQDFVIDRYTSAYNCMVQNYNYVVDPVSNPAPIKSAELSKLTTCAVCDQPEGCLNEGICHYTESDLPGSALAHPSDRG